MNYELIFGDCLEVLDTLPPASVDFIVADVPYGTTDCAWDSIIPFKPMWKKLQRVRKPQTAVALFGSEPFSSRLRASNLKRFKYDWVWNKVKGGNIYNLKSQPYKIHEMVSVFYDHDYYPIMKAQPKRKGKVYGKGEALNVPETYNDERTYDEKYPQSILVFSNAVQDGIHPTQKPVHLMEYLVQTYCQAGGTVLDFTCGSGSTGVAAVRSGCHFIGIDNGYCEREPYKDVPWVHVARERIANANGDFVLTAAERNRGQLALWQEE